MPRIDIPDETIWTALEAIAKAQNHRTVTGLIKAIASSDLSFGSALSLPLQQSYIRAVNALLEKGAVEDARAIAQSLGDRSDLSDSVRQELKRLSGVGLEWVEQVRGYISSQQPFLLQTERHSYSCLYADFWVGDTSERRTYLRAWVEEVEESDEPDALRHNRTFRLDKDCQIQPLTVHWRFAGIDSIPVKLRLRRNFKYTPKADDLEVSSEEANLIVIRRCWSVFWLLQDIRRYGDQGVVVEPQEVRDRVRSELQRTLQYY